MSLLTTLAPSAKNVFSGGLAWHLDSVDPADLENLDSYLSRYGGADVVNEVPATFQQTASSSGLDSYIRYRNTLSGWELRYQHSQIGSVQLVYELALTGYTAYQYEADCQVTNYTTAGARSSGVAFWDSTNPFGNNVIVMLYDNSNSGGPYLRVYVDGVSVYSTQISAGTFVDVKRTLAIKDIGGGSYEAYSDGSLLPVSITGKTGLDTGGMHFWTDAGASSNFNINVVFDNLKAYV